MLLGFRALDRLANLTRLLLRPKLVAVALVLAFVSLAMAGNVGIFRIFRVFGGGFGTVIVLAFWPFALLSEYVAKLLGINISYALPLGTFVMAAMTIALLSVGTCPLLAVVSTGQCKTARSLSAGVSNPKVLPAILLIWRKPNLVVHGR